MLSADEIKRLFHLRQTEAAQVLVRHTTARACTRPVTSSAPVPVCSTACLTRNDRVASDAASTATGHFFDGTQASLQTGRYPRFSTLTCLAAPSPGVFALAQEYVSGSVGAATSTPQRGVKRGLY